VPAGGVSSGERANLIGQNADWLAGPLSLQADAKAPDSR
jgi:hypothetical protein